MTRWYRAPELLTDCPNYGAAVDMWAIGCIFAEMLGRKALFQGRDPSHQLLVIIQVLGTPTEQDMQFITHHVARQAILNHGHFPGKSWKACFPESEPLAIDLLSRMLTFNPEERISVEDALDHAYLRQLHNEVGTMARFLIMVGG